MAWSDPFLRRVVVEGESMTPTFLPGERLTVVRPWRRVRVGDVVVVRDPREASRWLVKRVAARDGAWLDLRGDNPERSTDSRHFGRVRARDVAYLHWA